MCALDAKKPEETVESVSLRGSRGSLGTGLAGGADLEISGQRNYLLLFISAAFREKGHCGHSL